MSLPRSLRRQAVMALAFPLVLALGACGGAQSDATSPITSAQASSSAASKRALAAPATTFTEVQTVFGLFEWVEVNFAQFFPVGPATLRVGGVDSRTYPNGNVVSISNGGVYLQGPVVGSPASPVLVVSVADFCGAYPGACGTRHVRQVTVGGLLREYIVYEPWVTLGKSARPAVFMLHGTSGDGDKFLGISGWREKADSAGMVVVFPSALRHCFYEDDITVNGIFDADEIRAPTKWAFGGLGKASKMPLCTPDQLASLPAEARAAADHPLADDIAYFDAMVDDLKQNYTVDAKRLYLTGFSNGGQMAGRLAAERSTVFAAGASSAGPADPDIPTATRPMSYVATVGTVDDRFMAALGGQPLPLTDSGGNAAFINVMVKPFSDVQLLDPAIYTYAPVMLFGKNISLYAYTTSVAKPPAGNRLYVAVIEGLDHQYPNGKNHPVIMAEVLWPFFESQVLP